MNNISGVIDTTSSIKQKLRVSGVKVAKIVTLCEEVDINGDGLIRKDDLEDIFRSLLTDNMLSRRELQYLFSLLSDNKSGKVLYMDLYDIIESKKKKSDDEKVERWFDEPENIRNERLSSGSVGEFLVNQACPSEIRNFKLLISCLEKYERESGMKISIKKHDEGFTVPLGPDLRASLVFHMN